MDAWPQRMRSRLSRVVVAALRILGAAASVLGAVALRWAEAMPDIRHAAWMAEEAARRSQARREADGPPPTVG